MLKIRISKYIQSEQFCGKTELFCTFCSTWQVKTAHCNGMPEYLITKVGIVVFDLYHYNAAFQNFSGRSSGVTFGQRQRRNEIVLLAAASVVVLAVAALAGIVPLTEQHGQVTVLNPESYLLAGGIWAVDLEVLEGGDLGVAADGAGL